MQKILNRHWENWTLDDLGHGINENKIDPRELIDYFLTRIERDVEKDKIFVDVFMEEAKKEAQASYERSISRTRLSLYDGIPLVWKDNFDIKGIPSSAGLKVLQERVPRKDATAYKIAKETGFICLGKTNMTELAFSGLGINPTFGTPSNPFDSVTARVPGGSSSGSAVAVAKGLCCAGVGTDTGGSIRTPAAWNNLVGLKTTAGLISTEGVVPLSQTLDTVGFLTRCVQDAATLYGVIAQNRKIDLKDSQDRSLSLLVCTNFLEGVDPEVLSVFDSYIENLVKRDVVVVKNEIPEFNVALELVSTKGNIVSYEASKNWSEFLEAHPGCISQDILDRFRAGASIKGSDVTEVSYRLKSIREEYLYRTSRYDAVLMPTVVNTPPVINELIHDKKRYSLENLLSLRNTRIANLLGLCAISVPAGFTNQGLPTGVMLLSSPFSEEHLLRVALAVTESTEGTIR